MREEDAELDPDNGNHNLVERSKLRLFLLPSEDVEEHTGEIEPHEEVQ